MVTIIFEARRAEVPVETMVAITFEAHRAVIPVETMVAIILKPVGLTYQVKKFGRIR